MSSSPQTSPIKNGEPASTLSSAKLSDNSTPLSPSFAAYARKINELATAFQGGEGVTRALGKYTVLAQIGEGGQGTVFHARDTVLNRNVALKIPHLHLMHDPTFCSRLVREARSLAMIDHPNIVRIYEAGDIEGMPYLVFAYCPEGSLNAWLKEHGLQVPPRTAASWICQLARGLHAAHQCQVLHRDIKPNNVFIQRHGSDVGSDDMGLTLQLGDFGLAKITNDTLAEHSITQQQDRIGTPAYMSPEQVAGHHEKISPATDVYCLGVLLYELLTGVPLFGPLVTLASRRAELTKSAPSIRRDVPAVSADLEAICHKCLELDPAHRYPDGGALADDLEHFLAGKPIRPRPIWHAVQRRLQGTRWVWVMASYVILLGLLVFAFTRDGKPVSSAPISSLVIDDTFPSIKVPCKEVWAIAFSPDSKSMCIAGDSGVLDPLVPVTEIVALYDLESQRIFRTFPTHQAMIKSMAIVDDGKTLITSSYDGTVQEWDLSTGASRSAPWKVPMFEQKSGVSSNHEINCMVVSRDGQWIAVGTNAKYPVGSSVIVRHRSSHQQYVLPLFHDRNITQLIIPESHDPTYLYIVAGSESQLLRWNLSEKQYISAGQYEHPIECVAINSQGNRMAVAMENHQIMLQSWPDKEKLGVLKGHDHEIRRIIYSPDNHWLASVDIKGTTIWWDLTKADKESARFSRRAKVECLAFSPDGRWLASGRSDGNVDLFRSASIPR